MVVQYYNGSTIITFLGSTYIIMLIIVPNAFHANILSQIEQAAK